MKTERIFFSYLVWFFVPVAIFFVMVIPLSIFFEPISGDLTRIGYWSEKDFGWNQPQPAVPIHENGPISSNPDVIVLGDSFSHPNIWQSYLAESRKIEVLSFQYYDVGCVDNWLHWVSEKHYSNLHVVVIEVAERSFIPVFRNINVCARQIPKSIEVAETNLMPARPHTGLILNSNYLLRTALNKILSADSAGRITSGQVINAPLTTDKLFSNRKPNRLLYYSEDESKISWTKEDVSAAAGNLKLIQDDLAKKNLRLLVIVVPDKSSAYRKYIASGASLAAYPDVFEQLKNIGVNSVNLLAIFQQAVGDTIDLYLPNDTHLSTQGYRLLASKVTEFF